MAKRIKIHDLVNSDNTVSVISHQLRISNEMSGEGEVKVFNLEKLHPNIYNPRKLLFNAVHIEALSLSKNNYDSYLETLDENIKEQLTELIALANNIEQSGLLQPIVVTDHPTLLGEYMVVAGERRYWSHLLLGRTVIRAVYRQVDEKAHRVISIAENLARHDLTLKEKVIGLKELINMDDSFSKVDHVMRLFGIRKSAGYLLLKLIKDDAQYESVMNGTITQFRDIEGQTKSSNGTQATNEIPTVGKTKNNQLTMKLNQEQIEKLGKILKLSANGEQLIDSIYELLV